MKEYKYSESTAEKDLLTGLSKRPKLSFLQKTGLNVVKNVVNGQSPLKSITSAIGKSGLTPKQTGYLDIFKKVTKQSGGLKIGDTIAITSKFVKINKKKLF